MEAQIGDNIVFESERVGQSAHNGVIEEVSASRVATEDLTCALDKAGAVYELLPHAHTESALAEAQVFGLSPGDVAKSCRPATSTAHPTTRHS